MRPFKTRMFGTRTLIVAGALALSSGAAFAATATAVSQTNVRSGPGTQYEVIDRLPPGEPVNLIGCDGDWCEISMGRDGSGYAAIDFLDIRGGAPRTQVIIEEDEPAVISGLVIGGYWDNRPYYIRDGYYYWGGRWYGARPGLRGWRDRSWHRWEDRRRDARLDARRDRLDDRRDRLNNQRDRLNDQRDRFRERRQDARQEDRRDARQQDRQQDRQSDRGGESREQRIGRTGRAGFGDGGARAESRDRGDRMGLDRAGGGGGGRGDGGGRGGDGGGRGGDGGGRGGGGGRDR